MTNVASRSFVAIDPTVEGNNSAAANVDDEGARAGATVQGFRPGDPVEEGARNGTLFRVVRSHAANGMSNDEVEAFAHDYNVRYMRPPLPDAEVKKILRSVRDYRLDNRLWREGDEARIVVPVSAVMSSELSSDALRLMIFIEGQHAAHNAPFPLQADTMARNGYLPGWGRDKYDKYRRELVNAGFLTVHHQGGKHGKGHASMYRIARRLSASQNFAARDFQPASTLASTSQMVREGFSSLRKKDSCSFNV